MFESIYTAILVNLEQVAIGAVLFLGAYAANMMLGAWRNVKIIGCEFDWWLIANSLLKYLVLGLSIGLLTVVITLVPVYAEYVGIEIAPEVLETLSAIVIIGSFLTATVKYTIDAVGKVKDILE